MATNFPGSLDSFTNPSSSSTLDSPSHAAQHANINDAVEAVQTKLGVGAGTIGEMTSFTTSATNITISSQDCYFARVNDWVIARYYVVFAGAASGNILLSLPVAMTGYGVPYPAGAMGYGVAVDATASNAYEMQIARDLSTTTNVRFFSQAYGSAFSQVDNNTPFTWASGGDSMRFTTTYLTTS